MDFRTAQVLSFGIPFAPVPLLLLTPAPAVMGRYTNHKATIVATGGIVILNCHLTVKEVASWL